MEKISGKKERNVRNKTKEIRKKGSINISDKLFLKKFKAAAE